MRKIHLVPIAGYERRNTFHISFLTYAYANIERLPFSAFAGKDYAPPQLGDKTGARDGPHQAPVGLVS
jgi:hypothetical protein